MSYRHFGDFVSSMWAFNNRLALTIRPFLKIERTTYADLRKQSYQVAHYLISLGLKHGDRLMIVAPNSPDWVKLFLGAQLIGVVVVPVDVASTPETILNYASQTEPKFIFRSKHLHSGLDKKHRTVILDELREQIEKQSTIAPKTSISGDDLAVIVFTSGTTADPKGVMLTQRNILSNVEGVQRALTIDSDWRLLSVLPLSHMYELTGGCLAVLSSGASIFYIPRVTPAAIARGLQEYHVTVIAAIPQLLILLLERIKQTAAETGQAKSLAFAFKLAEVLPLPARRALFHKVHERLGGALEMVVTGGAPIPESVARAWELMGVITLQGYGLTETAPILTVNHQNDRRSGSAGMPLDNVRVRIAGDGEIQAKGPNIFKGYWNNQKATKEVLSKDGWFRTGDVGNLEDGWLRIQGRLKFAIVLSNGLKVFPEDIEAVTAKRPELGDVCIVGISTPDGEQVQAIVTSSRSDRAITTLIAEVNEHLASFQHIAGWRRWPDKDFPRTRLLKIDRKLVQRWANQTRESKSKESAADKNQDQLIRVLRMSLDKPAARIKESDRLADIGLDSLRRLNVVALVEEQMGISISESSVTQTTTVAALRRLVSKGTAVEPVAKRPDWPYEPLPRSTGDVFREIFIRTLLGTFVSVRVEGREHLKGLEGPVIFIFNHVDNLDAMLTYQVIPNRFRRHLSTAQADDFMKAHKVAALFGRLCYGSFNMARHEPYMPSLSYIGTLADKGWSVLIAPEGKISKNGKQQPFKSGAGLLAVELEMPVVIVKSIGLYGTMPLHAKWPKRHSKVTVRISEPVMFGHGQDYDKATRQLEQMMKDL
ncbi:MAG TPA: AMP-binding protein [Candidatus Saccharimonadales bacterium]|nr:AMP-binding protein [Candidatus Saccharimonadales bacterium]